MKFRATIRDPKTFAAICRIAQGFHRKAVLKLAGDRIRLITATGASEGTQIWTSCRAETLFADLRLESSRANTIYLDVEDMSVLTYALKSAERSISPTMKLAQGDRTQLLRLTFQNALTKHDVAHDIPVRVMAEEEINAIVAPPLERDVLQAVMPDLAQIATFVDRSKISSQAAVLQFDLQRAGAGTPPVPSNTLTMCAHTITASFSLQYQGVEIPTPVAAASARPRQAAAASRPPGAGVGGVEDTEVEVPMEMEDDEEDDGQDAEDAPLTEASVTVDAKRFARFLSVRDVNPVRVVGHFVDGRALVLSAYAVGETNLVYYIPASAAQVV